MHLTDLEAQLDQPDNRALVEQHIHDLNLAASRLRQELRNGHSRVEYQVREAAYEALEAAREVLQACIKEG